MDTMSKAEFIAMIERELPDDAQLVGFSTIGGEFFELAEASPLFSPVNEIFTEGAPMDEYVPENVTHVLEVG